MMGSGDPVVAAIQAARTPGDEFVPERLLAITNADSPATSTVDDLDSANAQFDAIAHDIGFVHSWRRGQGVVSSDEQRRLAGLMRWLFRELQAWDASLDPEYRRLAALFAVTAYCSDDGDFWCSAATSIQVNASLVSSLEKRIASSRIEATVSALSRTPLADRQIIDRFMAADEACDWVTIASDWPAFANLLIPSPFVSQSVRYLLTFAPSALHRAADQQQRTLAVMLVLFSLTKLEGLSLALASTNSRVEFGALLRSCLGRGWQDEDRTEDEASALTQLLLKIAVNPEQWRQWMIAINRYPVRNRSLQKPLGRALALVSDDGLRAYIDSMELSTLGSIRETVAECLSAFAATAARQRREALWTLAHERWSGWRFSEGDTGVPLVAIGSSELDYAIVGFAVECMSAQQRAEKKAAFIAELSELSDVWHGSVTDFMQAAYRILSLWQPYAHAEQVSGPDDWLSRVKYLPFNPRTARYLAMVFRLHP